MITEDNILFSNNYFDGRENWQDILFNGEAIGASCERLKGGRIFTEIKTHYQRLVHESEAEKLKHWYISEDEGYIFAVFYNLQEFINYVNINPDVKYVKAA